MTLIAPREVEGFGPLAELALDMHWPWNHGADDVWRQLDPALWELPRNPWAILQTVSRDKLQHLLTDPAFRKNVDALVQAWHQAAETPAWFQKTFSQSPLTCVGYFSMEFMLSEALPIYSGGHVNVAGDQLKAASDLEVPVVAVGLLYQQGYFRQVIDKDGAQQALFPYNDPGQLPIAPLRRPNGEWLRLELALPGYPAWLRAWHVQVGRVTLYRLDSNDLANFPAHRGITSELYGGGPELRLQQELVLGIGGWRLLHALGIQPEVCHLNEGHAAFAILERVRTFMNETGQPFEVALAVTRAGNLFTTHTAVPAGFDRFAPDLIKQYLGRYAQGKLGITVYDLLALCRRNPNDSSESFNMAYLAIQGSGAVNSVSRLHGKVSRHLPAAAAYRLRFANNGAIGREIVDCQHRLEHRWATLQFGEVTVEANGDQNLFEVPVYFDDFDPEAVRVELYADGARDGAPVRREIKRVRQLVGTSGYAYRTSVPATRLATDYTVRLIPHRDGLAVPLEDAHVLWQRRHDSENKKNMNMYDKMQGAAQPKRMRHPQGPLSSESSGQAAVGPARTASMKASERPLADYVAEVSERNEVRRGVPLPLGPNETRRGVNFALFSRCASRVRLELFDQPSDAIPARVIDLDPARNRTGDLWHAWVEGIRLGQLYAYRVDGPYQPPEEHHFNFNKLLLYQFTTAISPFPDSDLGLARGYDSSAGNRNMVCSRVDDAGAMPKCVFTDSHFDWHDDQPLRHPSSNAAIYELHICCFMIHPNSGVEHPGTYRGLMEKIHYLIELGITSVEFMPIHEFNEYHMAGINPQVGNPLRNYWGYDPVAFFAPKASYSSAGGLGQQTLEFKEMVLALHQAGIEVILDVVFNHTAEGSELGPTLCFRGIDNAIFYMLASDKRYYINYTGTGNTVNANHPVVRGHILAAFRYWKIEMHVDGFRFDLASILGRVGNGKLLANAPLLKRIAEEPILRDVKIIAEAWDAAGAYEVGRFSERRRASWNGRYRDDVRRFWRGDDGILGSFASRICGSDDIYTNYFKGPECSINYVTCHDGITLNDLVSYRDKHNEGNGQNNHDGTDANFSENNGAECETTDAGIETVRKGQIKNFLLTLLISRGVPMLLGGDEFRRMQGGNNTPYCQDNETSWHNWRLLEQHGEIFRFTRGMIAFRRAHPILSKERFYTDAGIHWFGPGEDRPTGLPQKKNSLPV